MRKRIGYAYKYGSLVRRAGSISSCAAHQYAWATTISEVSVAMPPITTPCVQSSLIPSGKSWKTGCVIFSGSTRASRSSSSAASLVGILLDNRPFFRNDYSFSFAGSVDGDKRQEGDRSRHLKWINMQSPVG